MKTADDNLEIEKLPPDTDPELVSCFLTESREYIAGAEAALLTLETDFENNEAVNTVFRAFHTMKGTSAFLGFDRVTNLAHHAESLLSRIRNKEIRCTGQYANLALQSIDMLSLLIQSVQDALGGQPMIKPEGYDALVGSLTNPETHIAAAPARDFQSGPAPAAIKTQHGQPKTGAGDSGSDSTMRVRTERLDGLIDLVGELVIAQSMVAQDGSLAQSGHHELLRKVTHAGKIVRELQDLSMSMRMVPLKATFQKMARLVRDVAQKTGKVVDFVVEGEDTEIDRNMVDVIGDPLVHMVRNAVDHGIETPDVREGNNKPRTGTVRLSAYHAGGNVIVELKDDGKGLDKERILKKAIANALVDADKTLSDAEIFNLIFAPGFSTKDQVTDLSGRGVGMDVVKRNIESLRGKVDIASTAGMGSTFTMRLPLTLAITDGMLMQVGGERYILPTVNIHMSFRPDTSVLFTVAERGEMVMFRQELMPIFRLHRLFRVPNAIETPTEGLLVIVGDGHQRCALLVDQLLGQQQFVAKSLGQGMGKVSGVSGGAILGDGRVGLILDPGEITVLARHDKTTNAEPELLIA